MSKIAAIQNELKRQDVEQVVLYDSLAIYYAIGKKFEAMERFIGLLVQKEGTPKLFLNNLFPSDPIEGVEIVHFNDQDDYIGLFADSLHDGTLAADKNLPARFLLPIMKKHSNVELSNVVENLRIVKDEVEIQKMREASLLNDKIMGEVEAFVKIGMKDKEIEDFIYSLYDKYQVVPSFDPIVAFRSTASDPHASANGQILGEHDECLVDMGCILNDYCSDMTRTFIFDAPDIEEIYDIVKRANEAAEAMVKPGVKFSDIDKTARKIIEDAGYGPYFTHRLGHGIGLECHEPKDVSSSNDDIVHEGYCFSIEPGIYLPGKCGVRIEDLVVVTKDGCEVLNHYRK